MVQGGRTNQSRYTTTRPMGKNRKGHEKNVECFEIILRKKVKLAKGLVKDPEKWKAFHKPRIQESWMSTYAFICSVYGLQVAELHRC